MKTYAIQRIICIIGFMSVLTFPDITTAQVSDSLPPESLQLPEVVITGIDRSKIQRNIPKVEVDIALPVIEHTIRDEADMFVLEGDGLFLRQLRQAEKQYLKALEIDPRNIRVYVQLGAVYRAQSQYVNAANTYEQALTLSSEYPEAHYQLGLLHEQHLQDARQALEHYRAYLEIGGTDRRVRIWIRDLERQLAGGEPSAE